MTKIIAATIMIMGFAVGARAQGLINFSNLGLPGFTTGVATYNGQSLNPGTYSVALYWDSTAIAPSQIAVDPFAPQMVLEEIYNTQTTDIPFPGGFSAGTVKIQGLAAGSSGFFEVVGWTGSAPSLLAAFISGAIVSYSPLFNNITGGAGAPASVPADLTGWDGNLSLTIPEPTTLAIGGFGAALTLIRRRK